MSTTRDGSGLRKRQRGFAAVPNETAQDRELSARARGVLLLVISLPEDWDLRMEWLVQQFPEGRDAITTAVRELRRAGYYRVERRRRDDGTFTSGVSVSDVRVTDWAGQHAAACVDQDTDKPKWDVSLRVRADGSVEDEPRRGPADTPLETPEGEGADTESGNGTANGFPVSGAPVIGQPVTGPPVIKDTLGTKTHTSPLPPGGAPDAEIADQLALVEEPEPAARKSKRKTGIPADWQPSPELCEWTSKTAPGMPRSEIEAFRDFHIARGNTFAEHDRAWRTWVRKWLKYDAPRQRRNQPYRDPQRSQQEQIGTTDGPPASDGWDVYIAGGQNR